MDYTTLLVALLSLGGTLAGSYFSNNKVRALLEYRLDALEKKQDKHNSLIERVYHLEQEEEVIKEKISVANHRIEDLEGKYDKLESKS